MDAASATPNIKKMYEKMTYFDQYGGSVILCIVITIVLLLLISYCIMMTNIQPIIDDWPNQRCKPQIIPFAGFITRPKGTSIADYTAQNFAYCTQSILSSIGGVAVEPLSFVTSGLTTMAGEISSEIQAARNMFNAVRTEFQAVSQEIMGRILNVTIPLQQIVISMRDMIGKIQGTMTAGLFTLLGSYYTLRALLGAIAQFIVIILIALSCTIAALWATPFTIPAAITGTIFFLAISIPFAIILAFMQNTMKITTSYTIPQIKCFDCNTVIHNKKISQIRVGDVLGGGNTVTAVIKVATEGSQMYDLDGIVVSDSHIVKSAVDDKWVPVSNHPSAIPIPSYDKPYLYCLNTTNKTICVKDHVFTDWDEITPNMGVGGDFHKYLDGGFIATTRIQMADGSFKHICDVRVNDLLRDGEIVYGVVEIDGLHLSDQYLFKLLGREKEGGEKEGREKEEEGEVMRVGGGANLIFDWCGYARMSTLCLEDQLKDKLEPHSREKTLFHLLTNVGTFHVNGVLFYDYNAAMDKFLGRQPG